MHLLSFAGELDKRLVHYLNWDHSIFIHNIIIALNLIKGITTGEDTELAR